MPAIVQAVLFGAALFLAVLTPLLFLARYRRAAAERRRFAASPSAPPVVMPSEYSSDPATAARMEAWDRAWRELNTGGAGR
jgi:hypothetical protein